MKPSIAGAGENSRAFGVRPVVVGQEYSLIPVTATEDEP